MFKLTWNNPQSGIIEYSNRTNFKAEFKTSGNRFIINEFIDVKNKNYAKFVINGFVKENKKFIFHQIEPGNIVILRDSNRYVIGQEYDFLRGREKIYGLNDESVKCQNYRTPDRNITVRCISKSQEQCYDLNVIQTFAKFEVL